MTIIITVLLGLGALLIISAIEGQSLYTAFTNIMSGKGATNKQS